MLGKTGSCTVPAPVWTVGGSVWGTVWPWGGNGFGRVLAPPGGAHWNWGLAAAESDVSAHGSAFPEASAGPGI